MALANASTLIGKLAAEGDFPIHTFSSALLFVVKRRFPAELKEHNPRLGNCSQRKPVLPSSGADLREVGNYVVALEYAIERPSRGHVPRRTYHSTVGGWKDRFEKPRASLPTAIDPVTGEDAQLFFIRSSSVGRNTSDCKVMKSKD